MAGYDLSVLGGGAKGISLHDFGQENEACREPINVVFDHADRWQLISNFAKTPSMMQVLTYASVEGFGRASNSIPHRSASHRKALGMEAKAAARGHSKPESLMFGGWVVVASRAAHRRLMLAPCRAKFSQSILARDALLATGERPLAHRTRRDSATIPGANGRYLDARTCRAS